MSTSNFPQARVHLAGGEGISPRDERPQDQDLAQLPAAEAIPRLLDEHGPRIHRLALRLCGHRDDAEELVQDIFLQAFRGWEGFQGKAAPTTWLYTIAARACQRKQRRRAGEPAQLESLAELLPSQQDRLVDPSAQEDPLDQHLRQEARDAVEEAIAQLPADYRMPLVLKEIAELPLSAVASILDLNENTVKTRLRRARLKLREALQARLADELPYAEALADSPEGNQGSPSTVGPGTATLCFDLLQGKMEALDQDLPFEVPPEELCQRCRAVFSTLDLARDVCRELGEGKLPAALRRRLRQRMDSAE
ncbi:MAG: RNA polymerase sigma factor [Acidobacteriota bacterium]